jgi:hypothetical protein
MYVWNLSICYSYFRDGEALCIPVLYMQEMFHVNNAKNLLNVWGRKRISKEALAATMQDSTCTLE